MVKEFIFALCLAILLSSSAAAASGGRGLLARTGLANEAMSLVDKVKLVGGQALVLLNLLAVACGVTGCSDQMQAGKAVDMIESSEPEVFFNIGLSYNARAVAQPAMGAQLAVKHINDAGGINGTAIMLLGRNNYGAGGFAYANVERDFIYGETRAQAIIGPTSSSLAEVVDEIAQTHRIPLLLAGATSDGVTAAGDYIFLSSFTDEEQGSALAQLAVNDLEAKTAAVLVRKNYLDSESLGTAFATAFTALGGEVVARFDYPDYSGEAIGSFDYITAQLRQRMDKVAELQPHVVFVPGGVHDSSLALKTGREAGVEAVFLGGASWDTEHLLMFAGEAAEGAYFSAHFAADDPNLSYKGKQFVADYTAEFDAEPSSLAALAFDSTYLIAEAAMRAVKKTGKHPSALSGADIRDELAATTNYERATNIMSFNANRHPQKRGVIIKTVHDGKIVYVKTIN